MLLSTISITISCTATDFPPLRGYKPAREQGVSPLYGKHMIKKLSNKISGKLVLLLFSITNVVYISMLFYSLPKVSSYAPELVLFDMSPTGYNYATAMSLLKELGSKGRDVYLSLQLPLDFIYPTLFSLTYSFLIIWLVKRFKLLWSMCYWIAFLPIAVGLFDYAENFGIILMLMHFPEVSEVLVQVSSFFTVLKSMLTTLYFVALLVMVLFILLRRYQQKQHDIIG
jgi:hypothetical protein